MSVTGFWPWFCPLSWWGELRLRQAGSNLLIEESPQGLFRAFLEGKTVRYIGQALMYALQFKISDLWRDSTKLLEEMGVEMVYEEYYDEDGRLYQWETCIQPDVYVHMDIEDLRQGKDTVIEWVLAQ